MKKNKKFHINRQELKKIILEMLEDTKGLSIDSVLLNNKAKRLSGIKLNSSDWLLEWVKSKDRGRKEYIAKQIKDAKQFEDAEKNK